MPRAQESPLRLTARIRNRFREFWDRQQKVREERIKSVIEDALAALPRKQGVALAVTLNALLLEC
jgi:hypothetical protein